MRGIRVLAGACLVAVLAGCSTSAGEDGSAPVSQPAPAGAGAPAQADTAVGPGAAVGPDTAAGPGAAAGSGAPVPADAQRSSAAGQSQFEGSAPNSGKPGQATPLLPVGQPVTAASRQVVRDANLELRVDDLARATEHARLVGPSHGGFVATEESAPDVSSLTLRVASTELDAALAALAELGEVTARRLVTQDVTEQVIDLEARINSQRASVERVRALLDRADTIGEVVQVESELTWRQAELDSLQQRAAALADQVALSTIQVRLTSPEPEPAATGGFGSSFAAGWTALLVSARVLLRVLGAVLPFALVLAVPVGAVLLWYRRRRRTARPATSE